MAAGSTLSGPDIVETVRRRWMFRHPLVIRLAHWINVVCLAILLMSGLQIFNAHPALYWGAASTFDAPFVAITDDQRDDGTPRGIVYVAGHTFDTTGVLGLSNLNGQPA
ncbi:MAG TPA: cytochrome b/b6 domain-containing protein, partial [Methylobacterium sp.]|nr:cytochrome b/b6 domain-containing protein [Methylobacterium sp.]